MAIRVLLLVLLVGLPATAVWAEDEEPLWRRCYDAAPWFHSVDVPDTEREMKDLVMRNALVEHSRRWIREAIAEAPTIEACLEKAGAANKLLLWYVPAVEGQHNVLPHLLDRYMMVGPWSDPAVVELLARRYVSIRIPAGGELAAKYGLTAPSFLPPGILVFSPAGSLIHRMDRISTFDPAYFRHVLATLAGEPPPARDESDPLAAGRFEEAIEVLSKRESRTAKADFRLGLAYYLAKQEKKAFETWRRTAKGHPDSPWGWKASACAELGTDGRRGESALVRSMGDPRWMADDVYVAAKDTQWRRTADDLADVRRRALDFLLTQQRSDGSWPGFRWGRAAEGKAHNLNIDVAIAAIGCAALHAWRDARPGPIDDALKRGEAHLLDDATVKRGDEVAWVYADAYRLQHFVRRLPELKGSVKRRAKKAVRGWIRGLVAHQEENGGCFLHYTYRSTFVTAGVASILHEVQEAGHEVPDAVFAQAADLLEGARGPNGLFGYLLDNPAATRTPLGAAARQPLCVRTLFQCGRAKAGDLERAVAIFRQVYAQAMERARKANFHIPALHHTAGYYFFYDFLAACEAARACGSAEHRKALTALLCELPEIDGSFIDCGFSYGKSYSTAMALLSMRVLADGS